jgi:hypothetical protein
VSRAAVAQDLSRLADRDVRYSTTGYRLLGENIAAPVREPVRAPRRSQPAATARFREFALQAELHGEAHYPASSVRRPHTSMRVAHPQWLFGTFVCFVALLAVGPVMASGRTGNGVKRIAMSGYAGAVTPAPGPVQPRQETVIDVTTAPQAAPAQQAPRPAAAPSGRKYELLGAPSVSVGMIESVLKQYGSEAVGRGQAIYDLGVRYGIDPAYALAFFVHESGCGTKGVARFTHSIGNIRWTAGYDNYEGYRSYSTWEQGIEDWYKLMTDLYINGWGLRTVDKIIPVYAPYGDNNNPPVYAASVKSMVDSWRGK